MNNLSFEEVLDREGKLIYSNVGTSMLPLIKEGRDILIIEKPQGRLKKYEIPLYKRASGQYVLHRVLEVRKQDYVICGDNRFTKEYGVTDEQILGVLTSLVRKGKKISLNSFSYKLYVHLWCDFFPIRAFLLRCLFFAKRVFCKLFLHKRKV